MEHRTEKASIPVGSQNVKAEKSGPVISEEMKEKAQYRIQPVFERRRNQIVEQLYGTATALRETGRQLAEKDQPTSSSYAEKGAARIEDLSRYLESRDVGELVSDLQDFARQRPWVTLGGSFLLGLTTARFLKASRQA